LLKEREKNNPQGEQELQREKKLPPPNLSDKPGHGAKKHDEETASRKERLTEKKKSRKSFSSFRMGTDSSKHKNKKKDVENAGSPGDAQTLFPNAPRKRRVETGFTVIPGARKMGKFR